MDVHCERGQVKIFLSSSVKYDTLVQLAQHGFNAPEAIIRKHFLTGKMHPFINEMHFIHPHC